MGERVAFVVGVKAPKRISAIICARNNITKETGNVAIVCRDIINHLN